MQIRADGGHWVSLESGSGDGRFCWMHFFVTLVVLDGGWLLVMVDIVGSRCYR